MAMALDGTDILRLMALLLGVPLCVGTPPTDRRPLGDAPFLKGVWTGKVLSNRSGLS